MGVIAVGADALGDCAPGAVQGASQHRGVAKEQVEIEIAAGQPRYLIVDGHDGASGPS